MKKISLLTLNIIFLFTLIGSCQDSYQNFTKVIINTDAGKIKLILYNETKLHKDNFIKLINEGYYDGQLFHRLIKDFMIQGGDPNSRNAVSRERLGFGGPGYTIPSEINPKYYHKKGALAAARNGDDVNPSKASSGSQFYLVQGLVFTVQQLDFMTEQKKHVPFTEEQKSVYTQQGGSPHLDGNYTVFGEIIEGFDVLDKIMNEPVDEFDRPLTDIKFSIKISD